MKCNEANQYVGSEATWYMGLKLSSITITLVFRIRRGLLFTLLLIFNLSGELSDCVVMTDKESGKSRGFGFVTYTHSAMVDEAMKNRSV